MSKTTNFYLAYITTKNEEEALTLANSALEKNLAACGNIFPKIKSVYKWDKKLQNEIPHGITQLQHRKRRYMAAQRPIMTYVTSIKELQAGLKKPLDTKD